MKARTARHRALPASLIFAALLLAGCAALKPPPPFTAELPDHAPVVTADVGGGSWPGSTWWKSYADPVLDQLIDTAIGSGQDMAGADARARQAQESE